MCYQIQQSLFLRSQQITVLCLQFKSLMFGSRSCIFPFRRSGRLIAWSYRHYGCFGRSRGFTAGIIIIFNGRRDDGGIAAVDVTVTWDGENRVIRSQILFTFRKYHTYLGGLGRAVFGGTFSGLCTYGYCHMFVADFSRSRSFCKIFSVDSISSWIMVTYAGYSTFSGFAADLSSLHTVRNRKSGIFQTFMYPVHDIAPDIFVERGSAVVHAAML